MAELYRRGESKRVVFFHVPKDQTDSDIARGAKVAEALIVALSNQAFPQAGELPAV